MIGKFDIKNWRYDGRKLAHPLTILLRMISYPFLHLSRYQLAFFVLIGWGTYDAKRVLEETA